MHWLVFVSLFLFQFLLQSCVSENKKTETSLLHLQLAVSLIEKDNLPLALKELLNAEELDPSNPVTQSYLGFIYFTRERYDLAEISYKKAISLKSDFSDAKNNLARIYIETEKLNQAEKLLQDVLKDYTYSAFPRAYLNYGLLEYHRKNYSLSINYLKKNLEKERDNCLARVYLGRSYLDLKDNQTALNELNKAIVFCQPQLIDEAHYYSAISLFRKNEKDLAILRLEELIKIFPTGKNAENARKMIEAIRKGNL
jgi:type IV pilus assembly protein PilF